MHLSKIGSRTTYLKCMNDLSNWKYIEYKPSKNPFKGSIINMFNFCTSMMNHFDVKSEFFFLYPREMSAGHRS